MSHTLRLSCGVLWDTRQIDNGFSVFIEGGAGRVAEDVKRSVRSGNEKKKKVSWLKRSGV